MTNVPLGLIVVLSVIAITCDSSNAPNVPNPIVLEKPVLIQPPDNSTEMDTALVFNWSCNATRKESLSYVLSVSPYNSFEAGFASSFSTQDSSFTLTTFEKDKEYYWRVTATDGLNTTTSNTFSLRTKESIAGSIIRLEKYMGGVNGYPTGNEIRIFWKLYPNAIGYNVYYRVYGDTVFQKETSGWQISVTGYLNSMGRDRIIHDANTYIYKVCAVGSTGSEIASSAEKAIVHDR